MGDIATSTENDERTDADSMDFDQRIERSFTCTACGYAAIHEVRLLQREYRTTCLNCGDWTVQLADDEAVRETVQEIAETLAGAVLTERQALAYLLRAVLEIDRQTAAEAMDTSPSNVDNLHRRASEKLADAERVHTGLDVLRTEIRCLDFYKPPVC